MRYKQTRARHDLCKLHPQFPKRFMANTAEANPLPQIHLISSAKYHSSQGSAISTTPPTSTHDIGERYKSRGRWTRGNKKGGWATIGWIKTRVEVASHEIRFVRIARENGGREPKPPRPLCRSYWNFSRRKRLRWKFLRRREEGGRLKSGDLIATVLEDKLSSCFALFPDTLRFSIEIGIWLRVKSVGRFLRQIWW